MIIKRNRAKAVMGLAAAAMTLGALSAAPAQAATSCNSTRLCWYQPNGDITNVDTLPLAWCEGGKYPGAIGNNYVRNRSDDTIVIYYDYNGDSQVTRNEEVVSLWREDAVTLNPSSRYFYCKDPLY
jgi:hypothetical protein